MDQSLAQAEHGWSSTFPTFRAAPARAIREALNSFVSDASPEQVRAWDESIPPLQHEVGEAIAERTEAARFAAVLEYELPLEFRRTDVIFLVNGAVMVLELKGKQSPIQADLDQASAYARDLRAYHRECEHRQVKPVLVLMRASGRVGTFSGVEVIGPDQINALATLEAPDGEVDVVSTEAFLDAGAYRPLPSLVEAARELLENGDLRRIKRAAAATEPTLDALKRITTTAAGTKTRHLVLVTGLPGSGKTLVGLQLAHARLLDGLAVPRSSGVPTAPAVYLSGNGPLVEVLQYELQGAGGSGKAFVRGVKEYVRRYSSRPDLVPPEHVLIFDEAQRAFDAAQVALKHPEFGDGKSEPEHFVEFAERVPQWCVVVGLIGTGQEIHTGEEAGLGQWLTAVAGAPGNWEVHVPPAVAEVFRGFPRVSVDPALELTTEVRYHLASDVHVYVAGLLDESGGVDLPRLARTLDESGYHLRITRDLDRAKAYLRSRYRDDPEARFGIIASSKDRDLPRFGVPNDFQSTKRVKNGPWFAEGESDRYGRSCRELRECVTEFGCQGLELDAALLAWGTDLVRDGGRWSNSNARGYQRAALIRDAMRLRRNAYRVLLTRGRDATVVFVPPIGALDETYEHLANSGFVDLQ